MIFGRVCCLLSQMIPQSRIEIASNPQKSDQQIQFLLEDMIDLE